MIWVSGQLVAIVVGQAVSHIPYNNHNAKSSADLAVHSATILGFT